jgi:hypothetical protein
MHYPKPPVDQHMLAAFLARTLPEQERSDVVAHLIADHEAREIVSMAADALSEARALPAASFRSLESLGNGVR